jgi:hypothetical protein
MAVIVEGDIQISLPGHAKFRRFDESSSHGLSHCMKAVDYIIELDDRIIFLEFKDPDHPQAKTEKREAFFENLRSGKIDSDLKTKFRDSFLYEWAYGRTGKPIHFWVLIGAESLDRSQLLIRTEALKRQLPVNGPAGNPWKNVFVTGCIVMNLAAWNKQLTDFPATRISVKTVSKK